MQSLTDALNIRDGVCTLQFSDGTGHRRSKEASILWSHHEETRELPGERDNARNNVRCTQARKATHGLDGQRQDVDRTLRGRVNQNDRGQGYMEKVRPWCGQPSDRGRLMNRTEQTVLACPILICIMHSLILCRDCRSTDRPI